MEIVCFDGTTGIQKRRKDQKGGVRIEEMNEKKESEMEERKRGVDVEISERVPEKAMG